MDTSVIWPVVKLRLGLADESLKPLIETYIEEIENRIIHYCKIKEIPDGLKFVWASMVIDAVRVELSSVDEIADSTDSGESIKIGDTSTSPSQKTGVINTSKSVIDTVVLNYRIDLNRYRKLRW